MDKAIDWVTFEFGDEFKHAQLNFGKRGLTIIAHEGICHINGTNEEFKKLGEFLIKEANKLDDLEFDHPMGQS